MKEHYGPPLAELIRPKTIDEVVGQRHLLGPGKPLRLAFESGKPHSMILWGPPGVGKTTLARLMAQALRAKISPLGVVPGQFAQLLALYEEEGDRWVDLHWQEGNHRAVNTVTLELTISNGPGVLGRVCTLIGEQSANISDLVFTDRKPDYYRLLVDVDLRNAEHLHRVMTALEAETNVSQFWCESIQSGATVIPTMIARAATSKVRRAESTRRKTPARL